MRKGAGFACPLFTEDHRSVEKSMESGGLTMEYYRVVVKCGHIGPKKSYEVVRYMEARDFNHLLESIKKLSRIKHRNNPLKSILSLERVSRGDFLLQREQTRDDPYLSQGIRNGNRGRLKLPGAKKEE